MTDVKKCADADEVKCGTIVMDTQDNNTTVPVVMDVIHTSNEDDNEDVNEHVLAPNVDDNFNVSLVEVKCGQLVARLHMEKFVCPGIHQLCIELDGELISPKEFTIRANKDKQKDWKGSIRIGKSNMRALMEMKSLDFYNHDTYCSAKCQSRNYITAKNISAELSSRTSDVFSGMSPSDAYETKNHNPSSSVAVSNALQQFVVQSANSSAALASLGLMTKDPTILTSLLNPNSGTNMKMKEANDENTNCSMSSVGLAMRSNPIKFWSLLKELGIIDDIYEMISSSVDQLRCFSSRATTQTDRLAERLTKIVRVLDLEEAIGARIHAERIQCVVDTNYLLTEYQELQRKAEESRRKLEETRKRSARFDELLGENSRPSLKRNRTHSFDSSAANLLRNLSTSPL